MNTSAIKPLAMRVIFDDDSMIVTLRDGRSLTVPLAYFPRLLTATPDQRGRVIISGEGVGLHWDELDEDINVEYLMMGYVDRHDGYQNAA